MKVRLTEKQLKLLISRHLDEIELSEDETTSSPEDAQPTAGTSDTQKGGQGYPEVTTWSDTVGKELTRGVGNPIDDKTKWADDIKITRGPGNELKEQEEIGRPDFGYSQKAGEHQEKLKKSFNDEFHFFEIPKGSKLSPHSSNLAVPKVYKGYKTTYTVLDRSKEDAWAHFFRTLDKDPRNEPYLPNGKSLQYFEEQFPNGTLMSFVVGGRQFESQCERKDGTNIWTFSWYFDKEGQSYNAQTYGATPEKYPIEYIFTEDFWDTWGGIIAQTFLTIAVGIMTGGASLTVQCLAQFAIQIPFSLKDFAEGNNIGAIMSLGLCFLPLGGESLGIGTKFNEKVLERLGPELREAKTIEEVSAIITRAEANKIIDKSSSLTLSRLLKQTPNKLRDYMSEHLLEGFRLGVKNGSIVLEKIPFKQLVWWKRLAIEGGAGLGMMTYGHYLDEKIQAPKVISELKNYATTGQIQVDTTILQDTTKNDEALKIYLNNKKKTQNNEVKPTKDPLADD